jgi:glucose/arabinose dehydrogenase
MVLTASAVPFIVPLLVPGAALAAPTPPAARVETLVAGLAIPWDVAPTPDGGVLFTERAGTTRFRDGAGTVQVVTTDQADLFVGVESGLMGITTDPGFSTNRTYYTCQAYKGGGTSPIDIRVIRWHLADDAASATRQGTVVTGLPITTGRHGGCRLRFVPDGTLEIGTGDAATGTNPQNLDSLGGKTLRVNASDGSAPSDNPFAASGGNRALVWTYGHRNVQGLAVRPGTTQVWNAEHGTDRDDEVNLDVRGGNYGWDPVPGYDESTPMTDTTKFPSAVRARWSSGYPTVATSGITFLSGSKWGRWEGALAVAELKGQGVRILSLTPDGRVRGDEQFPLLDNTYGRIRTVQSTPGVNSMYVTTSNGSNDKLLRVTATATQPAYKAGMDVSPIGASVVNRGGVLTAYVRGGDRRVWYATQSTAGGAWSAFHPIPGAVASAPAAVSWGGNRVDLFARSLGGQLLHAYSTGGGYSAWQNLGGSITSAPAAASLGTNRLDVVVRSGNADSLVRRRWNGTTWGTFSSLGGLTTGAPAASADRSTGRITVYGRGRDGQLCTMALTATGVATSWSCSADRETWAAPAVTTTGTPVLVTRNADRTPVVSVNGFTTAVGGEITSSMAVAVRSTSYVVLGRGNDGAMWSFDGRAGHYTWTRTTGKMY